MMRAALAVLGAALLDAARADVSYTVRSDGSGQFRSVQAALDFANPGSNQSLGHVTLHIQGLFWERVNVYSNFTGGVSIIGDGPTPLDNLIIYNVSGSLPPSPGTFGSWTMRIDAHDTTLVNVGVANNASNYNAKIAGQSVALHINGGDRVACFGCSLLGSQDTLYTGDGPLRSYFANTYINGTCDALFGESSTVWDSCTIDMEYTVTAHRGDGSSAYLLQNCSILSTNGVLLGRPWGPQATVIFKSCYMDRQVEPLGWDDWGHGCTKNTTVGWNWCNETFYAEYDSSGPGGTCCEGDRPWWTHQLNEQQAAMWNVTGVLRGWEPVASQPEAVRALLPVRTPGSLNFQSNNKCT